MNNTFTYTKTWILNESIDFVVERLLESNWIKKKNLVFRKERNNYDIEITGDQHPMWVAVVTPKNEAFDPRDWKIKQDFRKLKNLRIRDKKLYIDEKNISNIDRLLTYIEDGAKIAHDDNFLLFLDKDSNLRVFKIAAWSKLHAKNDGWYLGRNKLL